MRYFAVFYEPNICTKMPPIRHVSFSVASEFSIYLTFVQNDSKRNSLHSTIVGGKNAKAKMANTISFHQLRIGSHWATISNRWQDLLVVIFGGAVASDLQYIGAVHIDLSYKQWKLYRFI